ncbi:alpha/beta fold hydrolase [Flavobacteriaceae bacterium]|nr:alpha/beta fold hydrolase [Flavobacteriaceae bacterium]MDA9846395.1 alpha/beta fold hydrolase [Flavobacteriaceae bacterium]
MNLHAKVIGVGQPFIILHGFLGMGDNWKTMALRFSKLGYQIHLIDQRNHGRSFHDDKFDYELLTQDLMRYCTQNAIEKCILLGHSMGGKTAMLFTALYPSLVHRLIVADIAPRFYPVHHNAILEGLDSLDFSQIKSRKQADEKLSEYISELGIRQFLLKNLYWIQPGQLALRINLKALKKNVAEVGEALPAQMSVERSTLFLKGDWSEYIGPDDEKQISVQFSNVRIETIPNAGHWLHAQNPEAFFAAVSNFLS